MIVDALVAISRPNCRDIYQYFCLRKLNKFQKQINVEIERRKGWNKLVESIRLSLEDQIVKVISKKMFDKNYNFRVFK